MTCRLLLARSSSVLSHHSRTNVRHDERSRATARSATTARLRVIEPDAAQAVARVLADPRRMQAHAGPAAAERHGQQRRTHDLAGLLAVGQRARRQARRSHSGAGRRTDARACGSAHTAGRRLEDSASSSARASPDAREAREAASAAARTRCVVGRERRVRLEVGKAQHVAERLPLRSLTAREEDLLAVLHA